MKKITDGEYIVCLHVLLDKYTPAKDARDADTFMSTSEISEAIQNHTGEYVEFKMIVYAMKKMGYCYGVRGELCFVWLLKKRE